MRKVFWKLKKLKFRKNRNLKNYKFFDVLICSLKILLFWWFLKISQFSDFLFRLHQKSIFVKTNYYFWSKSFLKVIPTRSPQGLNVSSSNDNGKISRYFFWSSRNQLHFRSNPGIWGRALLRPIIFEFVTLQCFYHRLPDTRRPYLSNPPAELEQVLPLLMSWVFRAQRMCTMD